MKKIITLYHQYQEVISYLFWGVVTTVVNLAVFQIFQVFTNWNYMINNTIAWFISVLVAYLSNRAYVFHSTTTGLSAYLREITSFFGGRLAVLVLEQGILFVGITLMHGGPFIVKIIDNVIVVILNYFWSKWAVFRDKKKMSH
ncbi:GtrA family protein [Lentilactobacillus parafarraginis]|jgi:putative flippase GtrA|uniref:Cell wall teichoic acid glycosylation protein GtcA n=2 Tax=Lentilactobacillus parafarraginis TaxID=390842 RepID=A0A0R1YUF2_9LACO|nr:GtrA family protein [Lentilactobacillus parafarraginis]KRM45842.1 cell wall teichoic acid glycosylation protein GtcA [Lentilactobacillus parafarraginis DSM 18390 = JCM 14109]TLQ19110.1 GtrA family protein [Lentilactobacillus parafarraginis]